VRENRTPGSVRGASGNRRPYRDGPVWVESIRIVMERLQNKQGEATRRGGAISVMSVTFWPVRAAGCCPSALCRSCRRIGWDDTNGSSRTGGWRDTSQAETTGRKRKVRAGSPLGRRPNPALQRIAARWRLC